MRGWSSVTPSVAVLIRDVVVPLVGLWLIIGEARRGGEPRWELICLYGGMIGLPSVSFLDWRNRPEAPPPGPPSSLPPADASPPNTLT